MSLKKNKEAEFEPELYISFFNSSGDEFSQDADGNIDNIAQKESDITIEKPRELTKKFHKIASNREDGYVYPPVELLDDTQQKKLVVDSQELQQQAKLLMEVLQEFGINGEITSIRSGPVVTMYELKPAAGIKTARVIGLADDIARSMSAISARIATVPGQNVIGIELPNHKRQTVYMRDLLLQNEFKNTTSCSGKFFAMNCSRRGLVGSIFSFPALPLKKNSKLFPLIKV